MTTVPYGTRISFMPSERAFLKYGSIYSKIATLLRASSYFSRFFRAASFTILLNVSLSNANKVQSVFALIEAARGALYKSANSPKASPG